MIIALRLKFSVLQIVLVVLVATACGSAVAQTTGPATTSVARPTTAVAMTNCATSQCHADIKNYKVVHGPVNVNACDACHKVEDVKSHTFSFLRPKTEACTFCHKMDLGDSAVVHQPVQTGDCLPCHNPHGG